MNFDEAVKAHSDWKLKLAVYIQKPDRSLNAAEVCLDNKCALGQWLHSTEGKKYAQLTEYTQLVKAHADFHKAAGGLIQRADKGESVKESIALGANSDYAKVSSEVIRLIMLMKHKVASTDTKK